jgi:hypothetical protein
VRKILCCSVLGLWCVVSPLGCGGDDTIPATVAATGGSPGAGLTDSGAAGTGTGGGGANSSAGSAGAAGSAGSGGQSTGDPDGSLGINDSGADASVECCPVSPEPACTMYFGRTKTGPGDTCGPDSDGMPYPGPAWQLATNEDGCQYWIEPAPRGPWDCCGCAVPSDAGLDAGLCDAGTPDVPDLDSAVTVCEAYESCHICVQTKDSGGNALSYYVYPSDLCPCPDAEVVDGG